MKISPFFHRGMVMNNLSFHLANPVGILLLGMYVPLAKHNSLSLQQSSHSHAKSMNLHWNFGGISEAAWYKNKRTRITGKLDMLFFYAFIYFCNFYCFSYLL